MGEACLLPFVAVSLVCRSAGGIKSAADHAALGMIRGVCTR